MEGTSLLSKTESQDLAFEQVGQGGQCSEAVPLAIAEGVSSPWEPYNCIKAHFSQLAEFD